MLMSLKDSKRFWDANYIKVLDGIAGSGKSSKLDAIFKAAGISYKRYTSTNKLKRDALKRYGGHADTIAGGLFKTIDGEFFTEEKEPDGQTIVIDEILQTDSRVLNWIESNRGKCNIFVLTDTRQMLAPVAGEKFLQKFEEFKTRDYVEIIPMPETLRARDSKTKAYFYSCYKSVARDYSLYYNYLKHCTPVAFDELQYNSDDIYITHTNAIEKRLYQRFNLSHRYDLPLIPKGTIARSDAIKENYSVLPQADVTRKVGGYYQIENVGTPTRYQGSECETGRNLYYLVPPRAKVEPREWYTVVTRCYNIDSLKIVIVPDNPPETITEYFGKPVKRTAIVAVSPDTLTENGERLGDIYGERVNKIDLDTIQEYLQDIEDTDDTHYKTDCFTVGGKIVCQSSGDGAERPKITIQGLISKCPEYSYSFMPAIYKRYEYVQLNKFNTGCTIPTAPRLKNPAGAEYTKTLKYGLDLQASYPHILKFDKLPIDGDFMTDNPNAYTHDDNYYNFWTVAGSKYIPDGVVISWETVLILITMQDSEAHFEWLGACPACRGSLMGTKLYDMATDCKETNDQRKTVKYGWLERGYLYECQWDDGNNCIAYAIEETQNHAPLMWAIKDAQLQSMLKIKYFLIKSGFDLMTTIADGCFFNYFGAITKLGEIIKKLNPATDFRIYENTSEGKTQNILYQTYADLPTRAEKRKKQQRDRQQKYRQTKKLAQNCTE